ncbi:MAG: hypothetical protein AAGH15_22305, partial [Myxococcota bacterium]
LVASVGGLPAQAQRAPTVALAGVFADDPAVADTLRASLEAELREAADLRYAPRAARWVLHSRVTRIDVSAERVRCEVSVVVAERRGGAVRAMLSGRASGHGASTDELRTRVVRAAVKGALRPLGSRLAAHFR